MNRLVLIGNGFDLAHGLPTRYSDFINWYKVHRIVELGKEHSNVSKDPLLTIELKQRQALSIYVSNLFWENQNVTHLEVYDYIVQNTDEFKVTSSPFFERINKSIEIKRWVDIEEEYYKLLREYALEYEVNDEARQQYLESLNEQMDFLKESLVQYIKEVTTKQPEIKASIEKAIYAQFEPEDISIEGEKKLEEHKKFLEDPRNESLIDDKIVRYGLSESETRNWVQWYREAKDKTSVLYPPVFLLPDDIMLLNFNYTPTAEIYAKRYDSFADNHIHGDISYPSSVIFGYGDEIDENFKRLKELNENECLRNVKSIRYQEAPNYRAVLRFIESAPFQVLVMGHSCGNSDRTLLNTIFEHKNCISIKPYYHQKEDGTDNYIEMVQNISRNFTDMKLMRDRVVNKTQCEPLVKI